MAHDALENIKKGASFYLFPENDIVEDDGPSVHSGSSLRLLCPRVKSALSFFTVKENSSRRGGENSLDDISATMISSDEESGDDDFETEIKAPAPTKVYGKTLNATPSFVKSMNEVINFDLSFDSPTQPCVSFV